MPLTIRATWLRSDIPVPDGQLFIWAENLVFEANGRGSHSEHNHTAGNGRARADKVPSHPAQVPVGRLRHLVKQLIPSIPDLDTSPANAVVWLPSQNGTPLTRRGTFQRGVNVLENGVQVKATLSPWQVTGMRLAPYPALCLLSHLSRQRLIEVSEPASVLRHVRLGNDTLFWSHAAKFALMVLAGQHYLPGLVTDPAGRFYAVWQPYLPDATLSQQMDALVEAMPPVCRAYNVSDPAHTPAPGALVEHFISAMANTAIRHWHTGYTKHEDGSPSMEWITRLLTQPAQVNLPPQPAHRLYKEWLSWTEQLHVSTADTNIRLCFKLEPPELDQETDGDSALQPANLTWTLRYFLQARDDSSIVIPASEVWQANRNSLRINNRRFEQPQERLLAGLGIASRLFSPIQESLRSPRPEVAFLSTEEAYQFLREIGPLLESSGFAVMYPDWWHPGNRTRLGLRLRLFGGDEPQNRDDGPDTWFQQEGPDPKQQSPLNLSNLIRFKWELTLGDSTLDQAEFEQLAARRSPLVNIRGRWVELDPQQISAARNFLTSNQPEGHMNLLQAVRVAQKHLGAEHGVDAVTGSFMDTGLLSPDHDGLETDGLPVDTVDVDGWLRETIDRLRGLEPVKELGEPEGFVGTLRPYQRRGVGWLWFLRHLGLGSCLADDMGLGKTIQAIGLLLYARQRARAAEPSVQVQPALLICPTSLVANWRHEIERFAPGLKPLIHHGTSRLDGDDFMEALNDYDIVITSYGTARRDIELLTAIEWSDLILDEAQNIKNPGAKQTQAVRQIQARNRIALTGTPVENRLLELWSIMEFLNPGYLDNRERFRHKYVLPIERYNDAQASRELRQLVQPFLLRRLKTDPTIISDLPEKNEMVVYCPLTREQAQLYETVVQDTMRKVEESEGIQRRGIVLSLLMKLKQVCNHPAHFLKEDGPLPGRSGKLSRLTEMLEEALSVGDKALVFTQFVEMGHLLKRHLEDSLNCEVLFLHGGTPAPKRDQLVEAFQQEENGPSVFILSLRAGGVGLNLTRANQVFHFDRWWNPAVENQATDRAFRIGQRRSVQVYKFVVAGTLEERIHELIESKQALAENIVGSGEDWLTDISADELRKLLALRMDEIDG